MHWIIWAWPALQALNATDQNWHICNNNHESSRRDRIHLMPAHRLGNFVWALLHRLFCEVHSSRHIWGRFIFWDKLKVRFVSFCKEVNLGWRLGLRSRLNRDRCGGNSSDLLRELVNSIMNFMFMTINVQQQMSSHIVSTPNKSPLHQRPWIPSSKAPQPRWLAQLPWTPPNQERRCPIAEPPCASLLPPKRESWTFSTIAAKRPLLIYVPLLNAALCCT